jgi:DNA-directed RNA polymerase specialized sigma24 family protein
VHSGGCRRTIVPLLLLVELLGVDYEPAAEILRLRRGTVASRLHAARRRLRAALVAEGVWDADD